MDDDIDFIPLKNLPNSGLVAWTYDPWKPGDVTKPNNVLISLIDTVDKVSLVARSNLDGQFIFASSISDIAEVIEDLEAFLEYLKDDT